MMINKPGSHRGANNTKKKKFSQGELRKQPIPLIDKVRIYVLNFKEEIKVTKQYNSLYCHDIAKDLKCKMGEVAVCVNQLHREDLVSSIRKRYMSFSVYEDYREKENNVIEHEILFDYEKCPICNNELHKASYFNQIHCKYTCFSYTHGHLTDHEVDIFKKKFSVPIDAHKSITGQFVKDVEKEILRMKKNNRYVAEILTR